MSSSKARRGLLLSGGGARAAYQAGVLKLIHEISREAGGKVPFEILVGTSAGAINLAPLAAHAGDFTAAVEVMKARWSGISTSQVFDARPMNIALNAFRWFLDLALGGAVATEEPRAKALVDTKPLFGLLEQLLPPGAIAENIRQGFLDAVAVSATDYRTGAHTVFVESSRDHTLWRRFSRIARHDRITPAHILASCALPILFPAVRVGGSYYGDGSIRNTAPLSPAIHLGARRILAIGGRELLPSPPASNPLEEEDAGYPSPAKITGVLFDSIFLDALEIDREQMARINLLLEDHPEEITDRHGGRLRRVDFLYLGPSQSLGRMAVRHRHELPSSVRYMLRGLGAKGEHGGTLLSYLLFEAGFTRELLDLGYEDAKARSEEIQQFLWG
jgi:NTE family protein